MLAWLDIESTGLNPRKDAILEVGVIVTDDNLTEIWRNSWISHWHGDRSQLHPVVQDMHTKSGLFDECAEHPYGLRDVELSIIDSLGEQHKGLVLCGSTIGFDRSFLAEQMPDLLKCFHYRSIDVSCLTELARRWFPDVYANRPGADESKKPHRALEDLEFSIACLKYYRMTMFADRATATARAVV